MTDPTDTATVTPPEWADPTEATAAASWCLRTLADLDAEAVRIAAIRDAEIERVRQHYAHSLDFLDTERQQVLPTLTAAAEMVRAAGGFGKKKSFSTANGTFGFRTTPARVTVTDAEQLLVWAKTHQPDLVRAQTKEDVPHKGLAAYVTATGDLPDGTEMTPESEAFTYTATSAP